MSEPRQQRLGREDGDPGGGELDCERQAVESVADLGHRWRVGVVDGEIGIDLTRPLDEQPDRLVLGQHLQRRTMVTLWEHERSDVDFALAAHA